MRCLLACLLLAWTALAGAAPGEADLERRTDALAHELRCLVCQNQTVAESQAELAQDLKRQVRDMLREGRSEQDVVRFLVDRYGDFVVYRPPLRAGTLLLWFGPALALLAGAVLLVRHIRRQPGEAALDAAQQARASRLLDGEETP